MGSEMKIVGRVQYKLFFVILFFLFMIVGCSSENDCFVADSVKQIKSFTVNDKEYFLFLRITGFQEKESFYELYEKKPIFDICGRSELSPVSDEHFDWQQGYVEKLIVKDAKLTIVYIKEEPEMYDLANIEIEIE